MSQVTGHDTIRNCKIEYSTDGSNWNDISGYANSVEASGADVTSGEAYTFDGDYALIGVGKIEPVEITVSIVYTEVIADPFNALRVAKHNRDQIYLRYAPMGGDAGEWQFTSDAGYITSMNDPSGEANSGDPLLVEFVLRTPKLTRSTIAT